MKGKRERWRGKGNRRTRNRTCSHIRWYAMPLIRRTASRHISGLITLAASNLLEGVNGVATEHCFLRWLYQHLPSRAIDGGMNMHNVHVKPCAWSCESRSIVQQPDSRPEVTTNLLNNYNADERPTVQLSNRPISAEEWQLTTWKTGLLGGIFNIMDKRKKNFFFKSDISCMYWQWGCACWNYILSLATYNNISCQLWWL